MNTMKDLTQKTLSKAQASVEATHSFLSDLPILGDYQDKERRRDADQRLRESIAKRLDAARAQVVEIEHLLLRKGKLTALPYVDVAANRLQLLVDRVRTAARGYRGYFDAESLREEELQRLFEFDQRLVTQLPVIDQHIEALRQAVDAGEDYSPPLITLIRSLDDLDQRLDHRMEAIHALTNASSLPETSSSS